MKVPDLEVIKEIPGYKVILKAVLKSQIQQLVEQISSETEEETVVLSANLSDGSISYHGSELGRLFLDSHDEFKSQYLGFCLKRLHMKSREQIQTKDGSRESTSMEFGAALPEYRTNSSEMCYSSKRVDLGLRHEPYKKNRGRGNRSNFRVTPRMSPGLHDNDSSNNIVNKMEPESNFYGKLGANLHVGSMDSQQSLPQVSETVVTSEAEDNQGRSASYTENSSINEHVPSIDTYSEQTQNETSNLNIGSDGTVNIKQECSTDSETDLKITGMELPQSGFIQDESLTDGMSTMLDNSRDMSYETSVAMGTSDLQSKHRRRFQK
ncbi:uncharacterized protein LOC132713278 [Ruditapes philippinarum]|uniref:uncharacterized protein LOC132713278 n=1 Tax=Ruditapes philippinarum TaxID=129788 RepID=UPI00295B4BED|nr:uncharacterized protein LOC132713278 [Ruditapes philippinarum]